MGLTIHYDLAVPTGWTLKAIRSKLEQARQFAKTLPVIEVSEMAECSGKDADFQAVRDAGREEQDTLFWAKIQAQRYLLNPREPGCHSSQPPNHMVLFSVLPADGCEQMNVGVCSYPKHVWKARGDDAGPKAWSLVFDDRNRYPESRKVMRAFMNRWKLRRLPKSKRSVSERFGSSTNLGCFAHEGLAQASIRRGRYLSHRRGYGQQVGIVTIRDRMVFEIAFRYMGTPEEAQQVFSSPEFRADLDRMVVGVDHVTPAASGIWSSFTKTQFANSPECGGTRNFVKAHLSVLAILECLQGLGFDVTVRDESDFWKHRNIEALVKTVGEWDAGLAALFGAMKDVAAAQGMIGQSAMEGRSDFERLEMQGQASLSDLLKKLTTAKGEKHEL